jgi:K+-sensing histidine kinase KdpD
MMHKVYSVNIETKDSVIVFELDKPITMGVLSNIIDNNYSSSSEIIAIDFYSNVVSDVE